MLTLVLRAVKWPDVLRRCVRAYKIHRGTAAFGDLTRRVASSRHRRVINLKTAKALGLTIPRCSCSGRIR